MKNKTVLQVRKNFEPNEADGICEYLQDMAQQGWLLQSTEHPFTFQKGTPKNLRYSAVYLPYGSNRDTILHPLNAPYTELCAQAGWRYVCNQGQLYFFVTELQNPIPIETDEGAKLRAIIRQYKKNELLGLCLSFLFLAFAAWLIIKNSIRYISLISLLYYAVAPISFIFMVVKNIKFINWLAVQKQRLARGLAPEYPGREQQEKRQKRQRRMYIVLCVVFLFATVFCMIRGYQTETIFFLYILVITFGQLTRV